ncbi:MAG: YHS domain-containing protein [Patescibacteria group bacterium]
MENDQSEQIKKVIDIVCGMELDPGKIKSAVEYKGETYYFCSDSCWKHFVDDPKRYVG